MLRGYDGHLEVFQRPCARLHGGPARSFVWQLISLDRASCSSVPIRSGPYVHPATGGGDDTMDKLSRPRTTTRMSGASAARRLDGEEDRVVASPHEEEHGLALARFHPLVVGSDVLHRRAGDLDDDVTPAHAGVGRRTRRIDLRHHDALQAALEAEVLRQLRGQALHGDAEILGPTAFARRL